jgi:MFS family permease
MPTLAAPGVVACLLMARGLRDLGDGLVAVLLPVHLLGLGLSPFEVGVVATVALLGSACLTLGLGLAGPRLPMRRLLLGAAALMVATGVAFFGVDAWALLLVVAFLGTINPSSGSVSVFVPLEHAALTAAVGDAERTRAFARYSLVGALAAALGALLAGLPDLLARAGHDFAGAVRAMFVLYAALGLAVAVLYARLPAALGGTGAVPAALLGPSRPIVLRLAALFSLDAFAGGLAVQSLLALWLFERFGLSLAVAGAFFFWSGLLSAVSFPLAARLARRFGLINTMVWTHIPSSVALILAALAPSLWLAMALLLVRAALSQMDVPTRSSYVMAVVTAPERAAAASFTAVPRSLAAAVSPALAGALLAAGHAATPLLLCGSLKILYDLLLLRQFGSLRAPEERTAEPRR